MEEIGLSAINKHARTRAIADRVAEWLTASLPVYPHDGGAPASQRAYAGDVLTALGDPRFDPERYNLPADEWLGFVHIPADPEFRIGTRKADVLRLSEIIGVEVPDDEINDALSPTQEFYIARYLVTVAQFRSFVEATGFETGDARVLRDPDSRPVRWVTWHEALAYCAWLNEQLANSRVLAGSEIAGLFHEGHGRVALPSELEWEKAARGNSDAVFAWGDMADPQRANYSDTGINATSAVGCFPANGFELYDMIGNVWEWTRSLWGKNLHKPEFAYPYDSDDQSREDLDAIDDVRRVVRGGAWINIRGDVRCACRSRSLPDFRFGNIGFRVVFRSAPVRSL